MTRTLHLVVPASIDDPARPSGGNAYDRRLRTELEQRGWVVHEHQAGGSWPHSTLEDEDRLAAVLDGIATGIVLVDGLIASSAPSLISLYAGPLRVVVLVHLPLGVEEPSRRSAEAAMLRRVDAVVVTSPWTRSWLVEHEGLSADRVRVAVPGADPRELAPGTPSGGALLCVGPVTRGKGHDVLLDALHRVASMPWQCICVGSLDIEPEFADDVLARADDLDGRVLFTGPLARAPLESAYLAADVLLLPSRTETYGMVLTEALAHGLPAVASAAGGVPDTLGTGPGGVIPGMLVPPGDPLLLAAALQGWLRAPALRARARTAARQRRLSLPQWSGTAAAVEAALLGAVSQHQS